MKLKTRAVYIYYDFPIVFSAINEEDRVFICLFADEYDKYIKYFCKEVSASLLVDLEENRKDLRTVFENHEKLYAISLNAQSKEPVEAIETSEDITPFLPEKDFFIGVYENRISQTEVLSIPSYVIGLNYNFSSASPDYSKSSTSRFQTDTYNEAIFSGDCQWLTEAA